MSKHCNRKDRKEQCDSVTTIETLKVRKACIKNLRAKNAKIDNLEAKNITLNGVNLECRLSGPPVDYNTTPFLLLGETGATGPSGVTGPANVDPEVFEALIQNARTNRVEQQARIAEGRNFINEYLIDQGCPLTCPPPPTEPVPLEIYGVLTLPIYRNVTCGPTGTNGATGTTSRRVNTAIDFNLQIVYLLEVANSIDARNVSVLIQVGYLDSVFPGTGDIHIDEVFIANKQLYPTLDILYGENFANLIPIPTPLLQLAVINSPNPNRQGAIQMVIFKEQGLCIWNPTSDGEFQCLQETTTNAQAGAQSQEFNPQLLEELNNGFRQIVLNSIDPSSGSAGDTATLTYTTPSDTFLIARITGVAFGETVVPVDPTTIPDCAPGQTCTLTVTIPEGTGTVNVTLRSETGLSTNAVQFTYL